MGNPRIKKKAANDKNVAFCWAVNKTIDAIVYTTLTRSVSQNSVP